MIKIVLLSIGKRIRRRFAIECRILVSEDRDNLNSSRVYSDRWIGEEFANICNKVADDKSVGSRDI